MTFCHYFGSVLLLWFLKENDKTLVVTVLVSLTPPLNLESKNLDFFFAFCFTILQFCLQFYVIDSVTRLKLPNVHKSCPKMTDFDTFTKIA